MIGAGHSVQFWAMKIVLVLVCGILLGGLVLLVKFERNNAAQIRLLMESVNNDRKDMRQILETQNRIMRGLGWER
jgi:hypothetical protein